MKNFPSFLAFLLTSLTKDDIIEPLERGEGMEKKRATVVVALMRLIIRQIGV